MSDLYFSNVILLLHFDGANGATTFVDDSPQGWTCAANTGATLSTADALYGTAALSVDSTALNAGCYVEINNDPIVKWGTGDYTLEGKIKTTASSAWILFPNRSDTSSGIAIFINASGHIALYKDNVLGQTLILAASSAPVNTGAWTSWSASRVGGTLKLFVDGVEVASGSDPTNYLGTILEFKLGFSFFAKHEEIRFTKGVGRYTGNYTTQTEAFSNTGPISEGLVSVASMLGAPQTRGFPIYAEASVPSMIGAPAVVSQNDFTNQLDETAPNLYVMDLVTPGGLVRVPISSWQATLQTDVQSYVQCVVPAATDWVPDIEAATEFVISRVGMLLNGDAVEYEMARAPAQTVSLNGGSYNYTATISGYTAALESVEDPPASLDRTLTGVRTVSRNSGNTRVRCDIDWLLRPGQRAYLDAEPIIVSFTNYYVPGFDQYMDIGDRA